MLQNLFNLFKRGSFATPPLMQSYLIDLEVRPEKLSDEQQALFNHLKENKSKYYQNLLSDEDEDLLINKFYSGNQNVTNVDYYQDIPHLEIFRLLVDLKKQKQKDEYGFVGYEKREPGCLQAMYDAFLYIQSTMDEPLCPQYIKNIHKFAARTCPQQLSGSGWGIGYYNIPLGKFKEHTYGHINMGKSWVSPVGYMQMAPYFTLMQGCEKGKMLHCELTYPAQGYEQAVQDLINHYNQRRQDERPVKKLRAVVDLIQNLDRLHPFKDGNTRVFITLLLNRELILNGFSPTMLYDPNRIEGHSLKESMHEVLRGMENFQKFKQGENLGYPSTEEIARLGHNYPITQRNEISLSNTGASLSPQF